MSDATGDQASSSGVTSELGAFVLPESAVADEPRVYLHSIHLFNRNHRQIISFIPAITTDLVNFCVLLFPSTSFGPQFNPDAPSVPS